MRKRILIGAVTLYVLASALPTINFYSILLGPHISGEPERSWWDNRVLYSLVSADHFSAEYESKLAERITVLLDSLGAAYSFAGNLPKGFAPYEVKRFVQPAADPGHLYVLELLDIRLNCGCPKETDRFWLVRLVINPNDLSSSVCIDMVRPWHSYIPQYLLMS